MNPQRFDELVSDALDLIPPELAAAMDNVVILVEDRHPQDDELLGLYEGVALTELRVRYLDDDDWNGDIVIVSHGAAIRLASAVLAGVDGNFALDHHIENAQSVVLTPITDGRWSCVRWGTLTPPFYPQAGASPVADAVRSGTDPMG